jgi:excisionase family DNA binding protein
MNDILDETEVGALLACEPSTVLAMARERQIPCIRLGRSWRFPREALLQWVNRRALDHTAPAVKAPSAVAKAPPKRKAPPALPSLSSQA